MQDYEALRARVEETAQRMKEAQTQRTEGNQSLVEILGSLESKFTAQEEELAFYKGRIGPLEHSNAQLSELIGKLLDMVDGGFGDDSLQPMRRATEMASAMLDSEMAAARSRETLLEAPGGFEDVEPEVLATDAATSDDDLEGLPEFVRRGMVEQQSEAFENAVAHMDEPGTADAGEEDEPVAEIDVDAEPVAEASETTTPPAGTIETVEALAVALDQKSASGEPLEAGDIKTLLERVEALANQPGDSDDDGLEIPPARDGDQGIERFIHDEKADKTGTVG